MGKIEDVFSDLQIILKTASEEDMRKLEETSPFDTEEELILFVIACVMENESPQSMMDRWGISEAAAIWICVNLLGALSVPGDDEEDEE